MHKNMKTYCLAGLVAVVMLTSGWLKAPEPNRVSTGECYAVCTYEGAKRKYIGASSGGCDSACEAAEKKCRENRDTPCTKIRCTATDCY
jgi:hypothetical protein